MSEPPRMPDALLHGDAPSTFEVFDLSITLGPGFVPWVSVASRLGHVHGIPRRDPLLPPVADLLDWVYDYVDAVRYAEHDTLPDLRRALGRLVFGEPAVLELFQATRGVAADHGREVLLRILASPHLAALPWELLPDPGSGQGDGQGGTLALAPDVSVVRLARGRNYPIRVDRLEPPLNLLLVLSSPTGRGADEDALSFDIYEEKRSLLAELQPLQEAGLLHINVEDQPTLYNLRRRIGAQRRGYHLFHYIGHAEPDRLILEDESGHRDDLSGSRFMEVLRLCPDLRLAVFAGCETARAARDPLALDLDGAEGWRHILSLADRCVQASSPAVVGMQAVLGFRTERLFTRFFYQGLASGYSIPGAMRLARGAARSDRHVGGDMLDWSVPVLFVGGAEPGPLLDRRTRGAPIEAPVRQVLRLGLRQRDTRFFARDVALRQAIDVLSGKTPERVLVLTGPPAVGKTMLIDRALEEIDGPVSILYLRLQDLASELATPAGGVFSTTAQGGADWLRALAALDAQAPLHALCRLVAELLGRDDGRRRDPPAGQSAQDTWLRLIEDLGARRFVLVIDEVDALLKQEERVTQSMVSAWLKRQTSQLRAAGAGRPLQDLLAELVADMRIEKSGTGRPGFGPPNPLLDGVVELHDALGGLNRTARDAVAEAAQAQIDRTDTARTAAAAPLAEPDPLQPLLHDAALKLNQVRTVLNDALRLVADRRSGVRLAVVADKLPEGLLALPSAQRFVMRLGRLTWAETWRWIRRNLPGLLRYGEDYLQRQWPRLGSTLELWEELERRVLEHATPDTEPDVPALLDEIAPRRSSNRRPGLDPRPRAYRPLRVAVAGPHIASADRLAEAITRLASEHGVGGRAVTDAASEADERGSLAVLVNVPSPFGADGAASEARMQAYLQAALAEQPDIVLLDYSYGVASPLPDEQAHERPLLAQLGRHALLVAAGGHRTDALPKGWRSAPAIYPEVLAVGPCDEQGKPWHYAERIGKPPKPELFMCDQLRGTALEAALTPESFADEGGPLGPGTHGSTFAALHAVAAAILVWSLLPGLNPDELRRMLLSAATPAGPGKGPPVRVLTMQAAMTQARRQLVRSELSAGPCGLMALAAITGLEPHWVGATLDELISRNEVRRLTRGRVERYEQVPVG